MKTIKYFYLTALSACLLAFSGCGGQRNDNSGAASTAFMKGDSASPSTTAENLFVANCAPCHTVAECANASTSIVQGMVPSLTATQVQLLVNYLNQTGGSTSSATTTSSTTTSSINMNTDAGRLFAANCAPCHTVAECANASTSIVQGMVPNLTATQVQLLVNYLNQTGGSTSSATTTSSTTTSSINMNTDAGRLFAVNCAPCHTVAGCANASTSIVQGMVPNLTAAQVQLLVNYLSGAGQ